MTAAMVLARSVITRTRPVLYLLLALPLAGCGAPDPGPEFTAPGSASTGGTTQVPPVPKGLKAAAGNAQVMLTWSPSSGAAAYNVSRSVMSGGPSIPLATPTTNAYTDKGLTNGVRYYYVVAALNPAGASANSSQVTATPTAPLVGAVAGAGYWHTSGSNILDANGAPVRIAGINWYGFEGADHLVHGLHAQDYKAVLNTIKSLGYNVVRMPFSDELVQSNPVPTHFTTSAAANKALVGQRALTDLDTIVSYAGSIGLRIILDNHRSGAGNSSEASGLWYTSAYPQENWLADWQTMAARYSASRFTFNGNPAVIGVDLRNAPHLLGATGTSGACWTGDTATNGCPTSVTSKNWPVAAQAAGNAILAINPKLLVFVEGTDCYNNVCTWQGANLMGVATHPVVLNVQNQLVYTARDYGPSLSKQPWFNANTTPASLDALRNQFWGYISATSTAPVWLSEMGTGNDSADLGSQAPGSQGQWFQSLIAYLQSNPSIGWTYRALNGEDKYGLLDSRYDATPVSSSKQSLLQSIQFPLVEATSTPLN